MVNKKKITDMNDIDMDDICNALVENVKKDLKTFDDIINLDAALSREVYLGDIEAGVGSTIEGYIRYFNIVDNRNKVPLAERKPIKIFIHSGGGSLIETFIMMDAIKMSKTPVWTIATGACYSGGFFTFIAGHKRFAYPHASFLYHEGSAANGGTSSQFRNFTEFYSKQLDQLKAHVVENTNITEEKYEVIKKDDIWLTPMEAKELGIVDIITEEFV